jgi:hypothetical protein
MTAPTMEEWLNMFNSNMKKENRKWCGRQFWRRRVKTLLQYLINAKEKNFIWSDDHLATHYSFEPATALLTLWS